jgi:hypothetical protein
LDSSSLVRQEVNAESHARFTLCEDIDEASVIPAIMPIPIQVESLDRLSHRHELQADLNIERLGKPARATS